MSEAVVSNDPPFAAALRSKHSGHFLESGLHSITATPGAGAMLLSDKPVYSPPLSSAFGTGPLALELVDAAGGGTILA